MEVRRLRLVYFSPTGTTRKILEGIARGIDVEVVESLDLTSPGEAQRKIPVFWNELAIIGAPVYGGRLPVAAIERFKKMRANGTLAIVVVVYGNREFEDALLELKELAMELGFTPVAGGAFIGEHSFATRDLPIANGRPDSLDIRKATLFGVSVRQKIRAIQSVDVDMVLDVPGRFPYEGGAQSMGISPVTKQETCRLCGMCADACPMAAISIDQTVATTVARCIRCCACIKNCPTGSRIMEDPRWIGIAEWLYENCGVRKQPQIFGVDMNQERNLL